MMLPTTSVQPMVAYGLDPRKFLRGESVNYGPKKRLSSDTDPEASTGPHSVINQGNAQVELVTKSQSTERRNNCLRDLIVQRKEYHCSFFQSPF